MIVAAPVLALAQGMTSLLGSLDFVDVLRGCGLEDVPRYVAGLKPEVLVLMPLPHSIGGTIDMAAMAALGPALLLCPFASPALHTRAAFKAGVAGIVTVEDGFEEMPDALRAVAAGEQYVSRTPSLDMALSRAPDLTDRELEVCRLVARGYSNVEIAEKLYLSPRTVENHRASLRDKAGLSNRRELVDFALRNGLLA